MIYFIFVGPLGCFQLFITVNNPVINYINLLQNKNREVSHKVVLWMVFNASTPQAKRLCSYFNKIQANTAGFPSLFLYYIKLQKPSEWVVQINSKR